MFLTVMLSLAGSLLLHLPMRIVVPVWNGRVSPVCDVATHVIVVDVAGGEAAFEEEHVIRGADRVRALSELGVDVLICGAISIDLEERLLAAGIEVIAEMRGEVREVVRAYLEGKILQPGFSMPGGSSRRRRARTQFAREAQVDGGSRRQAGVVHQASSREA
jgi:predicted Fe-Mo cluster-binding NifX family protein